jgi:hypothetical protein
VSQRKSSLASGSKDRDRVAPTTKVWELIAGRARAQGEDKVMKNTVIAGLWLALIIGMPAGVGSGNVCIGLGLFLLVFLASGVAPAIYLRLKAKGK